MSPIVWAVLAALALLVIVAVIVVLHDRGLKRQAARLRAESLEFVENAGFKWEDQKKR